MTENDPTHGQLRQFLETLRDAYSLRDSYPDAVYRNKEDLLLRHGRHFTPQPLPAPYRRKRNDKCFYNAFMLATKAKLRYAEGVAIAPIEQPPVFPFHHA